MAFNKKFTIKKTGWLLSSDDVDETIRGMYLSKDNFESGIVQWLMKEKKMAKFEISNGDYPEGTVPQKVRVSVTVQIEEM